MIIPKERIRCVGYGVEVDGSCYSPVNDIVFEIDFGIFDFHQSTVGSLEEMMANRCGARTFVFDDFFIFNFFGGTNNLEKTQIKWIKYR